MLQAAVAAFEEAYNHALDALTAKFEDASTADVVEPLNCIVLCQIRQAARLNYILASNKIKDVFQEYTQEFVMWECVSIIESDSNLKTEGVFELPGKTA